LLKPFLALAYLETHSEVPVIHCAGASEGCWYSPGHGRQDMIGALANSCNVYFLQIAETLNRAALDLTCISRGLALPSRAWPASRLIGLKEGWPQTPIAIVKAFSSLARDAADSHTGIVLAGMLRCCQSGTAKAIGVPCYAKTGTALASERHDLGDGYVIAVYPVDQPRTVLLLGRHNATGAEIAKSVKPLLASLP
jgi:cell division protein FtsI/penicillin-binding protein 2